MASIVIRFIELLVVDATAIDDVGGTSANDVLDDIDVLSMVSRDEVTKIQVGNEEQFDSPSDDDESYKLNDAISVDSTVTFAEVLTVLIYRERSWR